MAASIPWDILEGDRRKDVTVLDPMSGSGTVPVIARTLGHRALGFDVDPLAVLIASSWCADVDERGLLGQAERIVARCADWNDRPLEESYPAGADGETREYLRYWFDAKSRRQLGRLAAEIESSRGRSSRQLLWCAFSRLIIVKQAGASRAMDVAHSRPHRVYPSARIQPLEAYLKAVKHIVRTAPFRKGSERPIATVRPGDARHLPVAADSVDYVITSPPYLNAIDYLRGHRLSLVWMGHSVKSIRHIRAGSVGTEAGAGRTAAGTDLHAAYKASVRGSKLTSADSSMLVRYLEDMRDVLIEARRVLKSKGRAVLVIGNCTIRGVFVENSAGLETLATTAGLRTVGRATRELPPNRRYLPPPGNRGAGILANRMREEVILTLAKP